MIREAVILAGGLGTRLREAVPDLPKAMAPVAGKPFMAHLLDYYIRQGIVSFVFSLGFRHEVIAAFLEQYFSSLPGLRWQKAIEDQPLGTGGGIRLALNRCSEEHVLVMNGDTMFMIDLPSFATFHLKMEADCSLILKPMKNSDRYGVVEVDSSHRITAFREKKFYPASLINGGVYALNSKRFLTEALPSVFSFEKDYLETRVSFRNFFGQIQDEYFIDIGIPDDFRKAGIDLAADGSIHTPHG